MPESAAPSVSAASTIAAVRDHPRVRNPRRLYPGGMTDGSGSGRLGGRLRKSAHHGGGRCFYTFPSMRKLALVFSFLIGLVAVTAAVALAAGEDPPAPEAVTSVDQLRGVSFVSSCAFSHRAPDDPIVFPGRPGASHDHTFLGAKTTDAYSTDASLRASQTTCKRRGETAAYWVPPLVSAGKAVFPAATSAYY